MSSISVESRAPKTNPGEVPWFPRHAQDLDKVIRGRSYVGEDILVADHPGFTDKLYRERRMKLTTYALNYNHGEPIPYVKYKDDEIETWSTVISELSKLHPTHACKQYTQIFPLLQEKCGYRKGNVPQLEDVSCFVKEYSGFQIRPVAGMLTSREFLSLLAFKVFPTTQYLRHSSRPMYTPEPDICHELLGHIPLLCDPSFAQFTHEIGLASLGSPDEYVTQLSNLYNFTVEFGLCKEDGQVRAYGAGLLSSFGELKHSLSASGKEKWRPFEPAEAALQTYPITQFQDVYYVAESFENAKDKLIKWSKTIPRTFSVHYNTTTQSVEVV